MVAESSNHLAILRSFQINNAGVAEAGSPSVAKIDSFDRIFDVNVKSLVTLTQLALPHLIESKGLLSLKLLSFRLIDENSILKGWRRSILGTIDMCIRAMREGLAKLVTFTCLGGVIKKRCVLSVEWPVSDQ